MSLSHLYGLQTLDKYLVITTNQITTKFRDFDSRAIILEEAVRGNDLDLHPHSFLTAALGNTWSHSVNTRLILQYQTSDTRQILVAKSPVSPFAVVTYTIQSSGLVQKGDNVQTYEGTDPGEQRIRARSSVPCVSSQC
ncbi:unnamed protein product [Lymnaea stagnalis]|uniref:Uncharacterized protein n=1 Tax=Lymnaea stagnalis TaxID=6523 RepID=A0AAV2HGQ9_LYMST